MTLYQFNQLTLKEQFVALLHHRTFLSTRWQAETEAVNLYALHGFFAEVSYDTVSNQLIALRSFSSSAPLEDYALSVQLPNWMT